jgi:hypothetical protein
MGGLVKGHRMMMNERKTSNEMNQRATQYFPSSPRRWLVLGAVVASSLASSSAAFAESGSMSFDSADLGEAEEASPASDESGFLAAAKVGGIVPFNGMDPFVRGGLELGWVFGGQQRRMAALLDVSYTKPGASGSRQDDRLLYDESSGEYSWEIDQHELVFQPTFLYRFTSDDALIPFVGIGPRIYLLETLSRGDANQERILETSEQSTEFGVGVPFGAEYQVGPGGLFAEGLLEWGPLDHRITGDASMLAGSLQVGYRAIL